MKGFTRDDYRKSFAKMVELARVLHEAGVPIVGGTDGWGIGLVSHYIGAYHSGGHNAVEKEYEKLTKNQPK